MPNTDLRIALVQSLWHRNIVDKAVHACLDVIGPSAATERFEVPGAFELPLHSRVLAETERFDAVIAAGLVVDGGIYRHEFVADAVISGLMRVQLDTGVPVFSSVLTPQRFDPELGDEAFFSAHMIEKGREVAHACLATLDARASVLA